MMGEFLFAGVDPDRLSDADGPLLPAGKPFSPPGSHPAGSSGCDRVNEHDTKHVQVLASPA